MDTFFVTLSGNILSYAIIKVLHNWLYRSGVAKFVTKY